MKKIIKNILLGLCFTQFIGCSPVDENLIDKSQIEKNANYAQGLLMKGYNGLRNPVDFSCIITDDATHCDANNWIIKTASGELTAQNNPFNRWVDYRDILYLNQFLSIVDKVEWKSAIPIQNLPQNKLFARKFKGEALALRAIMHLYLLQAHAGYDESGKLMGIPYYTTFIEADGNFNTPRLTFQETVDAIEKDFNDAYDLLPYIYSDNVADILEKDKTKEGYDEKSFLAVNGAVFKLRLQGQIVRGFQARLHLFAASKAFLDSNTEYKLAIKYAAELCAKNNYTLATDGVEFYNADNDKDNPEILWRSNVFQSAGLEQSNFPSTLNGYGQVNPSQNLVDAFYKADGYPITSTLGVAYNPQNPYANRDPRLDKYIVYNGGKIGTKTISINSNSNDGLNKVVNRSTRTGYYLKKLLRSDVVIPPTGTSTQKQHFTVYMRYTELYLILAEALNELGGPDYKEPGVPLSSRDIIGNIRKRALGAALGTDPYLQSITTKEDMRKLVQNERRLELCFEGFRFWDLRRNKAVLTEKIKSISNDGTSYSILNDVESRLFDDPKYYYMPLPYSEVLKFNAISQNKGW
jgi:hypothetical protein